MVKQRFQFHPGLSAGNYTIIVSFISSSDTLPDEKVELPFTILGTSNIILDADSLKITRGETVTLEGELVDHLGEPISDEERYKSFGMMKLLGTAITESDGDFSYDYLVTLDTPLANVTWSANFAGNFLHDSSEASQFTEIYQQTVINFQDR